MGFVVEKLSFHSGSMLAFSSFTFNGLQYKKILVQAWTGPEGSRRFIILDIKTMGT